MAYNEEILVVTCKTPIEIWKGWEQVYPSDERRKVIEGEEVIYCGVLDDEGNSYYRWENKALRILPGKLEPITKKSAQGLGDEEKDGDPALRTTGFASQVIELNLLTMTEYNNKQKAIALKLKDYGFHTLNLKYIQPKA